MMNYSIDARPTLELFFSTEEGEKFCVDMDGEISASPDEYLADLRWAQIDALNVNDDVKSAIQMAKQHAADNGWALSSDIFYN